jgi:hypothetical protein
MAAHTRPARRRRRDATCHLWQIGRGDDTRVVEVYISGTAIASADEHLPREVAQAKDTNGRSALMMFLGLDDPPRQVVVTTAGVSDTLPD